MGILIALVRKNYSIENKPKVINYINENVCITSAFRTAVGSYNKSLKSINAKDLGSVVISKAVENSKISNDAVDEVIMGQVLTGGSGQNPARQAAIKSGISKDRPAYIVNQVCGSGLRSIASGFQSIKSGDLKLLLLEVKKICRWHLMRYI